MGHFNWKVTEVQGNMAVQVETGSESSTPRTPNQSRRLGPFDAARDGGGHPGADYEWLTDWRLRAALSDKQELQVRLWRLSMCSKPWFGSSAGLPLDCLVGPAARICWGSGVHKESARGAVCAS